MKMIEDRNLVISDLMTKLEMAMNRKQLAEKFIFDYYQLPWYVKLFRGNKILHSFLWAVRHYPPIFENIK